MRRKGIELLADVLPCGAGGGGAPGGLAQELKGSPACHLYLLRCLPRRSFL